MTTTTYNPPMSGSVDVGRELCDDRPNHFSSGEGRIGTTRDLGVRPMPGDRPMSGVRGQTTAPVWGVGGTVGLGTPESAGPGMSDRIETLTARLTAANTTAAILTAQCDALDKRAADRHWTETDSAIGSGIRRKPNVKADARRYAGYSRDAQVYADRSAAESAVRVLESQLAYAIAERARVRLTRDDILGAKFVRSAAGWAKVRRVNAVTVSVDSGYSWADKIPFDKILEVKS